jgi:hypothetical protein
MAKTIPTQTSLNPDEAVTAQIRSDTPHLDRHSIAERDDEPFSDARWRTWS